MLFPSLHMNVFDFMVLDHVHMQWGQRERDKEIPHFPFSFKSVSSLKTCHIKQMYSLYRTGADILHEVEIFRVRG